MIKNEIKSIALSVKNLFQSIWFLEVDSLQFAQQMEAKLTSFYFNRFAYYSDIWPDMASFQKWGIDGLFALIEWMIPIVLPNIVALTTEVNAILDNVYFHTGVKKRETVLSLESIEKNIATIWWLIKSCVFSSKLNISTNQAFLNNFVLPQEMQKLNPMIEFTNTYTAINKNINTIKNTFGRLPRMQWQTITVDIDGHELWIYGILYYLYRVTSSEDFVNNNSGTFTVPQKDKIIRDITMFLNDSSFDFSRVYNAFMLNKKQYRAAENICQFMDQYIERSMLDVQWADEKRFDNISMTIDTDDFYLCIKEDWMIPVGSSSAIVWLLKKNIAYLSYLKNNKREGYGNMKSIFFDNVSKSLSSTTSYNKLMKHMIHWFTQQEISVWNDIFQETLYHINSTRSVWEQAWSFVKKAYESPLLINDLLKKIPWCTDEVIHNFFHKWEKWLGVNSWEVILMVFLIQAPYVHAVVQTISELLSKMPHNTPDSVKKYLIGFATYALSMFADNYVGEVVWISLIKKSFPHMTDVDAIKIVGPLAVVWWSMVITGNSPNAIIGTINKFYGTVFNKTWVEGDFTEDAVVKTFTKAILEVIFEVVTIQKVNSDAWSIDSIAGIVAQVTRTQILS